MDYTAIVQQIMNRAGEEPVPTTGISSLTGHAGIIKDMVNEVYHEIEWMKKWWWLEATAVVEIFAKYSTGTATVSDTTVTLATGVTTTLLAGDLFQFVGDTEYYEIDSITDAADFEITTGYIGTAPGTSYRVVRVAYSVPADYSRIKWVEYPYRGGRLIPQSWLRFQERRSGRGNYISVGDPEVYTVYGSTRKIYVDPAPNTAHPLYLQYIKNITELSADNSTPEFPSKYHFVLVYGTLGKYYMDIADDPEKAQAAQGQYQATLAKMMDEQDSHDSGDFRLKVDNYDARVQRRQVQRGTQDEANYMIHRNS